MPAAQESYVLIAELKRIREKNCIDALQFDLLATWQSVVFHGSSPLEPFNHNPCRPVMPACYEM